MLFARLWSLSHDLTHLDFAMPLISPKSTPTSIGEIVLRCTHVPIHSIYQIARMLFICMIWMWDAVCKTLEPQP